MLATVLASLPLYIAGFADQAGGIPANDADVAIMLSLDYDGTAALWNRLSHVGHGLMALTVVAFVGLMLKTFTGAGRGGRPEPVRRPHGRVGHPVAGTGRTTTSTSPRWRRPSRSST